ncbi:MAG: Thioredoxin family protein [uncultured Sulfurovum sp.]|uniref:Thioredoxin family protein n=1 Tax=uncultured Sulfurovum sp. TaxID=269237 RepID=A0A6S6UK14_9BACT|nr:MAG: Thioredoxin family protein [uncultured Sulfurovum sp.]
MFKKLLLTLFLSSFSLIALEIGDKVPQEIQNTLKLKENQLYVIDFFASWCKSCKKELPLISKVYDENITSIIAINVDKKEEKGKAFVKELELPFPIVYDQDKKLIEAFDPIGFPTLYYVKNGVILKSIVGAVDSLDVVIKKDIEELK